MTSFYHGALPEYYWHQGKPHYNLGNKIVHSSIAKMNPLRATYHFDPNELTQMPFYFSQVPQLSWLWGNLDFSMNKYHRHYQAHDDWYPDRKNKSLGHKQGGHCNLNGKTSKYMTLQPQTIPRGCFREIRKFQSCASQNGAAECHSEKISIMEVCPQHVLEGLREKRKWYLRAEAIDNQTYKRAMKVSDYNRGRSVSDLDIKDWSFGAVGNLRSDSTW